MYGDDVHGKKKGNAPVFDRQFLQKSPANFFLAQERMPLSTRFSQFGQRVVAFYLSIISLRCHELVWYEVNLIL